MRSFAVIAGFAAAANAYAVAYPEAYNTTTAAEYPAYPAETSSAVEYPAYTTTEVISATSFVCPEATTISYGPSTYVITSSTVLSIPEYTATYVPEVPSMTAEVPYPTAEVPSMTAEVPSMTSEVPAYSAPAYTAAPPAPIYPSSNGTAPMPPAGTATSAPSASGPSSPEFTGSAGKVTVGFMAIAGAVAAFL